MRHALRLHPDSPFSATTAIEVEVTLARRGKLALSYVMIGRTNDIRMPAAAPAARSDGLWRHTCFEAFIGAARGPVYYEFNFAPSTQWAAYCFSSYRSGMRVAEETGTPLVDVQTGADCFRLQASFELDRLAALPRDVPLRLGLSAVIEDISGRMFYWALAHPPGKPDFHHADGFAYQFTPA